MSYLHARRRVHRLVSAVAQPARGGYFHLTGVGDRAVAGMDFGKPDLSGKRVPGCRGYPAAGVAADRSWLLSAGAAGARQPCRPPLRTALRRTSGFYLAGSGGGIVISL